MRALAALLALSSPSHAQDVAVGPTLGFGAVQQRELRLDQTRYLGPDLSLGGVLQVHRDRLTHTGRLEVDLGYLQNRLGFASILLGYDLGYTLRCDLQDLGGGELGITGFLGGGSRLGLYVPEDPEHLTWSTAYELSVGPSWHRRFDQHVVGLTLLGSTVAVASRPPDRTLRNNDDPRLGPMLALVHSDAHLVGWPRYGRMQAALSWERKWAAWTSKLRFEATWTHFALETPSDRLAYRLVSEFRFGG